MPVSSRPSEPLYAYTTYAVPSWNAYPQSPPPRPVRISISFCKGSTAVKTSATCMRTVRLREGIDTAGSVAILRPVGDPLFIVGTRGSVISTTVPVNTASAVQAIWQGGPLPAHEQAQSDDVGISETSSTNTRIRGACRQYDVSLTRPSLYGSN